MFVLIFFFFKQKTAYEMRISDWSSDVCSSDLLMGDAAHTAHFSVGSGTKLALEDAIELARCLGGAEGGLEQGLQHYQDVRSIEVLKIQNAARNSTEWFENVQRYAGLDPEQ